MGALFDVLGIAVIFYIAYGLVSGAVYARYRAWGRTFQREDDALGYWSAIAAYAALAAMLFYWF